MNTKIVGTISIAFYGEEENKMAEQLRKKAGKNGLNRMVKQILRKSLENGAGG